MMVKVPLRLIAELPLNAESNATAMTVPGSMKGAMTARSRMIAPFGRLRSVIYAIKQPKTAVNREAGVIAQSEAFRCKTPPSREKRHND